jgi:hypothetical protein
VAPKWLCTPWEIEAYARENLVYHRRQYGNRECSFSVEESYQVLTVVVGFVQKLEPFVEICAGFG